MSLVASAVAGEKSGNVASDSTFAGSSVPGTRRCRSCCGAWGEAPTLSALDHRHRDRRPGRQRLARTTRENPEQEAFSADVTQTPYFAFTATILAA